MFCYRRQVPRPKTYDDADRARIVERAARVIATEGASGLSLRSLAADSGVSTTAVYSLIGGKDAVIAAVVHEATLSFATAQANAVTGEDAHTDFGRLGVAYRAWAIEHPSLYAVIFTGRAGSAGETHEAAAFEPLLDTVTRLSEAGRLHGDDPQAAALAIWGSVHGAVSLELELWPDQPKAESARAFDVMLDAVERAWVR